MAEQNKSIKLNTIIYTTKSVLSVLFPMITYPYILRILGVENIGRYNFIQSVIGYFGLLASLGLTGYASRDGAVIRGNRKRFSKFASEIFSLNIILSVFAYILLMFFTLSIKKLRTEIILVVILSFSIILTTIGVDWVYAVYEDYLYITLRQVAIQVVSLIMLFLFVRKRDDLYIYALISIIASCGANIWNYIHSRIYCHIRFTLHIKWRENLAKSLIFFASALMITIYVSTDQTMLGFMCGEYNVGLYSASVRIYHVLAAVLTASATVGCARLSNLAGNNKIDEYKKAAKEIREIEVTFLLPAVCGACFFCREIILLVGGKDYSEAFSSLFLLSLTLLGYIPAVFWGQCVLVANGKEHILLIITAISSVLNFGLNFVLIPLFKQDAAAFTTLLSESLTGILSFIYGRNLVQLDSIKSTISKSMVGCVFIVLVSFFFKVALPNAMESFILSAVTGFIGYLAIEFVIKNQVIRMPVIKVFFKIKGMLGR